MQTTLCDRLGIHVPIIQAAMHQAACPELAAAVSRAGGLGMLQFGWLDAELIRRFTTEQKLAVVAETMQPGLSISYVARRHGLSPSLVFRWRRLMTEGGQEAVRADDDVVPVADARRLEERVRELERQLGRKTLEVEILKEALDLARKKKAISLSSLPPRDASR